MSTSSTSTPNEELREFQLKLIGLRQQRYAKWLLNYEQESPLFDRDWKLNAQIIKAIRWCKTVGLYDGTMCGALESTHECFVCLRSAVDKLIELGGVILFGAIIHVLPHARHKMRNQLICKLADVPRRRDNFVPNVSLLHGLVRDAPKSKEIHAAMLAELAMSRYAVWLCHADWRNGSVSSHRALSTRFV